jgi:hypothetical protein
MAKYLNETFRLTVQRQNHPQADNGFT